MRRFGSDSTARGGGKATDLHGGSPAAAEKRHRDLPVYPPTTPELSMKLTKRENNDSKLSADPAHNQNKGHERVAMDR